MSEEVSCLLDTNVFVAAFRSHRGASNALLKQVESGRVTPLCSTALFLEYEAVLSRQETREATGHDLNDVAGVMRAFAALCDPVDISFRFRPSLRDPDDEMVLETALNGNAEAIATYNVRDFRLPHALGIEIATPGAILERLRQ